MSDILGELTVIPTIIWWFQKLELVKQAGQGRMIWE
jgi:hypothetical protein